MNADLTPLDVAFELVATKVAFCEIIETLCGTSPGLPTGDVRRAVFDWSHASPVPLPHDPDHPDTLDEAFANDLYDRADAIEAEVLEAVGQFFLARSEMLRRKVPALTAA